MTKRAKTSNNSAEYKEIRDLVTAVNNMILVDIDPPIFLPNSLVMVSPVLQSMATKYMNNADAKVAECGMRYIVELPNSGVKRSSWITLQSMLAFDLPTMGTATSLDDIFYILNEYSIELSDIGLDSRDFHEYMKRQIRLGQIFPRITCPADNPLYFDMIITTMCRAVQDCVNDIEKTALVESIETKTPVLLKYMFMHAVSKLYLN